MAESSLRAARPIRKGGLPNALFLVAAAEQLPAELAAVADEVDVLFPWGSLLRGALALPDAAAATAGIASVVRPGGQIRVVFSIDPRDGLGIAPATTADGPLLASRWAAHGLAVTAFAPATTEEIRATGSSWARRLRAGSDRQAWRLELARPSSPAGEQEPRVRPRPRPEPVPGSAGPALLRGGARIR
jgi:16S rRNA (adenine(1408)-N(1))-methyltransferase